MILYEKRASAILYNFLVSSRETRPFLLPANICPIVPLVFLKAGKTFELIDISSGTLCMDANVVIEKISKRPYSYAGIFFARTYGVTSNQEVFFRQLKDVSPELLIIDDRCLAPPDFTPPGGSCCDLVLYSTGYSKIVDIGWGGFGFLHKGIINYEREQMPFSHQDLLDIEASYKNHLSHKSPFFYHDSDWLDTTLPEVDFPEYRQRVELELARSLKHKAEINAIYASNLPPEIQLDEPYNYWRFNIVVPQKQKILNSIFQQGLFASSHYASVSDLFAGKPQPVTEKLHEQVINLFNDFYFDCDKAHRIVQIINEDLRSGSS